MSKKIRLLAFFCKSKDTLLIHTGAGDAEGAWRLLEGMTAETREAMKAQGYTVVPALVVEVDDGEVEKYRRNITVDERQQRAKAAAKAKSAAKVEQKSTDSSVSKPEAKVDGESGGAGKT